MPRLQTHMGSMMRVDHYEHERAEIRASTMNDQTKLERLAMIDIREERNLERQIKRYTKRLDELRRRMARSREDRQRELVRAKLRRTLYRSLDSEQTEGV